MFNLKDKLFNDFISLLTPSSIISLMDSFKQYQTSHHIKESEQKIQKAPFLTIMKKQFPQYVSFNEIFLLIFNRFRCQKCHISPSQSLSNIIPTDDIYIYDIVVALLMFTKCDFKDKIHTLFNLTDYDSDGFINKREISKMIYKTNILFCEEENGFKSESTLIHQSLGYIKATKALNMLLYYPGELNEVICEEKFITFDMFYKCLCKIENYKYVIIPTFINIKKCLGVERKEKELTMNDRNVEEFSKVANKLICGFGYGNNCVDKVNIKKYLQETRNENHNNIGDINNISDIHDNNNKSGVYGMKKKASTKKVIVVNNSLKKSGSTSNIKSNTNSPVISLLQSTHKKTLSHNKSTGDLDYDKFCHLELPPCKIKIICNPHQQNYHHNNHILTKKSNSTLTSLPSISKTPLLRTYDEIINDIYSLLDMTKNDDVGMERLHKISKEINHKAHNMKTNVKDRFNFQNDFKMDFYKEKNIKLIHNLGLNI